MYSIPDFPGGGKFLLCGEKVVEELERAFRKTESALSESLNPTPISSIWGISVFVSEKLVHSNQAYLCSPGFAKFMLALEKFYSGDELKRLVIQKLVNVLMLKVFKEIETNPELIKDYWKVFRVMFLPKGEAVT